MWPRLRLSRRVFDIISLCIVVFLTGESCTDLVLRVQLDEGKQCTTRSLQLAGLNLDKSALLDSLRYNEDGDLGSLHDKLMTE